MISAMLLDSCVHSSSSSSSSVYANPAAFAGQRVTICGYFDPPGNIYQRRDFESREEPHGISVADRNHLLDNNSGFRCLTGIIIRNDCDSPGMICTGDWEFDYAIEVDRSE
jgi:hypothetical protein